MFQANSSRATTTPASWLRSRWWPQGLLGAGAAFVLGRHPGADLDEHRSSTKSAEAAQPVRRRRANKEAFAASWRRPRAGGQAEAGAKVDEFVAHDEDGGEQDRPGRGAGARRGAWLGGRSRRCRRREDLGATVKGDVAEKLLGDGIHELRTKLNWTFSGEVDSGSPEKMRPLKKALAQERGAFSVSEGVPPPLKWPSLPLRQAVLTRTGVGPPRPAASQSSFPLPSPFPPKSAAADAVASRQTCTACAGGDDAPVRPHLPHHVRGLTAVLALRPQADHDLRTGQPPAQAPDQEPEARAAAARFQGGYAHDRDVRW